ncbi:DUF4003 family protein [Anaerocolumna sp.]|uniref:DUF4003 family protein n=1 Tax=Anaerocolumna sp. TaxID=2041569 RepID=UPI0028A72EF7|nr:DUF4003 family protein [Anaerocolumna sp.]
MLSNNLQYKCDLFEENYGILKKNFKWEYSMMLRLGAAICVNSGIKADVEAIKKAKGIIKNNTGVFSSFKDISFFILSTLFSLEKNQEEMFLKTKNIYEEMKKVGFRGSPYLTLAAFSVAKQRPEQDGAAVIGRAKEFYDAMKREHKFLTSADDYGYAAMLAATDLDITYAINEMEICYELLKKNFGVGNELQSLTHVLAMGEEPAQEKCNRVIEVFESLNSKDCKASKYHNLANLGILVLVSEDVEKLTDEIAEVNKYLLGKKGFGRWSLSKQDRTLFSSVLVVEEYLKETKKDSLTMTLANGITNLVIAQQTAMLIAVSSTSAAAAASSYGD